MRYPKHCLMVVVFLATLALLNACKTVGEARQETQQYSKLEQAVQNTETEQADTQLILDELKLDIKRLTAQLEQDQQQQSLERSRLEARLAEMETQLTQLRETVQELKAPTKQVETKKEIQKGLPLAKKQFNQKKYADAIATLKSALPNLKKKNKREGQFLLAESYFLNKNYTMAVLEYENFKSDYTKDKRVAKATYQQARSFRNLGKKKDARLFYKELIEKHPKNSLAKKAKKELKGL